VDSRDLHSIFWFTLLAALFTLLLADLFSLEPAPSSSLGAPSPATQEARAQAPSSLASKPMGVAVPTEPAPTDKVPTDTLTIAPAPEEFSAQPTPTEPVPTDAAPEPPPH
jgi:hypothetical protein